MVCAGVQEKSLTRTPGYHVADACFANFGRHITNLLCSFDCLGFPGTLRRLFEPVVMEIYLLRWGCRSPLRAGIPQVSRKPNADI